MKFFSFLLITLASCIIYSGCNNGIQKVVETNVAPNKTNSNLPRVTKTNVASNEANSNSPPLNPLELEAQKFAENLMKETFNKCDDNNWYSTWVTFESRLYSNDWSKKDLKIESKNGVIKLIGLKWELAAISIDEEKKRRGFEWEGNIKLSANYYQTKYFDPNGTPPKPYLSEVSSGYPSSSPSIRIGKYRGKWGMLKDGEGSIKFPIKRYLNEGEKDEEQNIANFLAISCGDVKNAFTN